MKTNKFIKNAVMTVAAVFMFATVECANALPNGEIGGTWTGTLNVTRNTCRDFATSFRFTHKIATPSLFGNAIQMFLRDVSAYDLISFSQGRMIGVSNFTTGTPNFLQMGDGRRIYFQYAYANVGRNKADVAVLTTLLNPRNNAACTILYQGKGNRISLASY